MNRPRFNRLAPLWRATRFSREELTVYSRPLILAETRRGLVALCVMAVVLLAAQAVLYFRFGFGPSYFYTCALLALLGTHIAISAHQVNDIPSLYLLGMTMLVVSGSAFVLLSQQSGDISTILLASVALLFMIIPMVPWGLREAVIVFLLIYSTFTLSTWSLRERFEPEALWTLQFIMAGAGMVSLALVARNVGIRKEDLGARYELECARNNVLVLSQRDPLTGSWNRRYLKEAFDLHLQRWHQRGLAVYFAFLDIDNFKPLNDTFGHDYGDQVLQWLCQGYQRVLGDHGIVVRMGGDEFALLFTAQEPIEIMQAGLRSVRKLASDGQVGEPDRISVSAGIIFVPSNCLAGQENICKAADVALYEAKASKVSGANDGQYVLYPLEDVPVQSQSVGAEQYAGSR